MSGSLRLALAVPPAEDRPTLTPARIPGILLDLGPDYICAAMRHADIGQALFAQIIPRAERDPSWMRLLRQIARSQGGLDATSWLYGAGSDMSRFMNQMRDAPKTTAAVMREMVAADILTAEAIATQHIRLMPLFAAEEVIATLIACGHPDVTRLTFWPDHFARLETNHERLAALRPSPKVLALLAEIDEEDALAA